MSLTSQIKDKNSPVRRFFSEFEKKDGTKNCLACLQSTLTIKPLTFTPSTSNVPALMGTTTDYLIRYAAKANSLEFENTIASRAIVRAQLTGASGEVIQHLEVLFKIGRQGLDGRGALDYEAIYSATALALMDNFLRSGLLPGSFLQLIQADMREVVKKQKGKNIAEKTTNYLFAEYFAKLGGAKYSEDISALIHVFITALNDPRSELYGAKMVVFNQSLANSSLVGGADFDCVFKSKDRLILTDIKTTTKPLGIEDLRQIIGYALLYDEKKDKFKFTHLGIYHSRSGSLCSLPVGEAIGMALAEFGSVGAARKAFIAAIQNT